MLPYYQPLKHANITGNFVLANNIRKSICDCYEKIDHLQLSFNYSALYIYNIICVRADSNGASFMKKY